MRFETLSSHHVEPLLAFERDNRYWFESMIAPRPSEFYSIAGVTEHIQQSLTGMANNTQFSTVLMEDGNIVARGNLKDISANSAYVGYRVSKEHLSQGLASKCLSALIETASSLGINTLHAQVLANNPASTRVLEKQGFELQESLPDFYQLNGETFDCAVYSKHLLLNP